MLCRCFGGFHARTARTGCLILLASAAFAQSANSIVISNRAAARFLTQATFGPTPQTIAHLQAIGFEAWLTEQFVVAPSTYPDPVPDANGKTSWVPTQQQFFLNAVGGADQLRQRVAWALGQIWVVSGVKLNRPEYALPYIRMLSADAFTNYRQIMKDVTLSPAMGHYLDMVNNNKATAGHSADENYAREVLQLFTVGLSQLNLDGTPVLDANGQPVPTYSQDVIEDFAKLFTGWTYAPAAGATSKWTNPANWNAPMVAFENHHDTTAKTLLNGYTTLAGQTAEADLETGFDVIMNHPNAAPFVSRQLIQHLVTGQPDPAYVARVATVFRSSNGDMRHVVRAILLDRAARLGDTAAVGGRRLNAPAIIRNPDLRGSNVAAAVDDFGTLREPVLFITATLRGLDATVAADNALPGWSANLGEKVFFPPSVFNYFAPSYVIPGTSFNSPVFQIQSTSSAMLRASFVNSLVYGSIRGVSYSLDSLTSATSNSTLLEYLNNVFLAGSLNPAMSSTIQTAMNAQSSPDAAAQAALYLVASSQQFQVQQ